jgi:hypothetical protein
MRRHRLAGAQKAELQPSMELSRYRLVGCVWSSLVGTPGGPKGQSEPNFLKFLFGGNRTGLNPNAEGIPSGAEE